MKSIFKSGLGRRYRERNQANSEIYIFRGMREYLIIFLYFFIVFSLFPIYKAVLLGGHEIEFVPQGLALINALALAKVILVGQELHLAHQSRDVPLIYRTLLKSFVYTSACLFQILEKAAVGMYHGEPVGESIAVFAGGSWKGVLSLMVLLFVVLIPLLVSQNCDGPSVKRCYWEAFGVRGIC